MNDGLTDEDREGIQSVLATCPKVQKAILFGSRAMGTFRSASDVDIALEGEGLTLFDLLQIKVKISDLNLPIEVDLLLKDSLTNPDLIKHIETHGVIFWEKRIRIKDIAIFNKSSFSKKKCGRDIVSYLDTGNITANKIDKVIQYDLTKENLPSRAKRKVKKLDIVYSCVRPNKRHYGILKNPDENMLVSTGFSVISVNLNKANPFYIYYYIIQDHIINYLQAIAEGSVTAYPTIKSSDIASLVIKLPALEEQTKIAAILSSLDDKIELNHKINANLEAQAQAIFKSYFIDFEPFKNGEFIDSELGKIPKGWRVGKLSEIIDVNPKTPLKNRYDDSFIEMKALPTQGYCIDCISHKKVISGSRFQNNDILFARITPCLENGKTGIVFGLKNNEVAMGSTEFIVLRGSKMSLRSYIACLSRQADFREYVQGRMNGSSGRQRVQANDIKNMFCLLPSKSDLEFFEKVTEPIFSIIEENRGENKILCDLCKTLLPKLMSGKIRIEC